jgi:hypothetical protein
MLTPPSTVVQAADVRNDESRGYLSRKMNYTLDILS